MSATALILAASTVVGAALAQNLPERGGVQLPSAGEIRLPPKSGLRTAPPPTRAPAPPDLTSPTPAPIPIAPVLTGVPAADHDTVRFGPNRGFPSLQAAIDAVRPGGTVDIEPGTYRECATVRKDGVTLRGLTSPLAAPVILEGPVCGGKALLIVAGEDIRVIGLTFRGAAAPPWNNGAGIRLESGSLTVEDSRFIGNENGILTGADPRGRLTVRRSRFEGNGKCEPDCAHGLYAGLLADLTIEDSLFVGQRIGHHIKSRAARTTVVRTWIDDGAEGTASYLIDLPNAGDALIADNRLRKGRRSDNRRIAINMGTAEPLHARRRLILRGNDIASDIDRPVTLVRDRSGADIVIDGNRLAGRFELPPTR